ncbi:MAG: IS4 family transposase [Bacteroidota bacterium]|nr:IS4 family transposase [Bacteroidota bacterium]
MHHITVKDFPGLDFGDVRRNNRFVSILNNISKQPGSSIPKQNEGWYDTKATYSFYSNEDVTLSSLQQAIASFGCTQVEGLPRVLVAHDISNISYNDLQAEGLGYLANKDGRGIICYSSIAISDDGVPLSLLYQHSWTRPEEELGKASRRKTTPFEQKESYEWYKGMSEVNKHLDNNIQKIHIADREADIYELFFSAYEPNTDLLIRSHHNRQLSDGSHLWEAVSQQPLAAAIELQIPDKTGKKRTGIEVEVRYHPVEILRPIRSNNRYESVELTAIEIKQTGEKKDGQEESLHWKLLTSVSVSTVTEALGCVRWYCYRWLIERFHYVLKSGTRIEELQLKEAGSLQKAIHVYSLAAMRIMQMVYQSRVTPQLSCEVVLTKQQWIVLYMLIHKKSDLPAKPPTLGEAVKWIGKLGGHLGRKSDGPPGLKTVWLGYQRICDAANVYEILNKKFG